MFQGFRAPGILGVLGVLALGRWGFRGFWGFWGVRVCIQGFRGLGASGL